MKREFYQRRRDVDRAIDALVLFTVIAFIIGLSLWANGVFDRAETLPEPVVLLREFGEKH